MSQLTQQMDLAPMTQVKYFSAETIEAAWLRPSMKSPCGNTDVLPRVVYYRLGYNGKRYFKKTLFHEVAIKQYIHTKS